MTTTPTAPSIEPKPERPKTVDVLIADKFPGSGIEAMERLGCTIHSDPDITATTLPEALRGQDPDVLIVRSTKVTPEAFQAAGRLSLVIRAGAGYDTIDVAAASARGVFVANCPGKNAIAVAELTWGLILACDRRIPDQTADLRAGTWDKKGYGKARGLAGGTLGIVGLGRIGREVAQRGRAFGMNVVAWSRSLTQEKADCLGIGYCSSLINLAKMADVVSVNVAATPETKDLIDEPFCLAMKDGAILVNTSRGSVVSSDAVTRAIAEKHIRVGMDVWAKQPAATDTAFADPLINHPGVFGTHHCGASTDQAQQAVAAETVRIVDSYIATGQVPNCVNRCASTPATTLLTVRHLNRPGVLAHVFYTLGQSGINVEEMENIIYEGHEAACARIQLDDQPAEEHLTAIRANDHVLSVTLSTITTTPG